MRTIKFELFIKKYDTLYLYDCIEHGQTLLVRFYTTYKLIILPSKNVLCSHKFKKTNNARLKTRCKNC